MELEFNEFQQPYLSLMNILLPVEYGSLLASCLLTTCLFSSLLLSSCAATGAAETVTGTLSFFATCCSFGKCLLLSVCLLIGRPSQPVHLCIFTWMVGYVGVFFSGAEERATHSQCRATLFSLKSQINISPHVMADFNLFSDHLVAT